MPLTTFSGTLGIKRAAHLLRRATFGAPKATIDTFSNLTVAEAMAILFPSALPDVGPPIDPAIGQEWITVADSDDDNGSSDSERQEYFKGWLLGQMLSLGVPEDVKLGYALREKIVFFMHTHFTTMQSKVDNSRHLYYQNALFRYYAFDGDMDPEVNFCELTKKLCVDNAMLIFLDGRLNMKGSPNENFARELFELFVIGKGYEDGLPPDLDAGDYLNFTEQDVQAAARVLSGWNADNVLDNIDLDTMLPRGKVRGGAVATAHDNDPKQFSFRLGNHIIEPNPELLDEQGRPTEESALDEIGQLIDLLYAQDETARYICRKIYRFFVYSHISPSVETEIIQEMANTFKANGFKIQPVLEELFQSQHFYEASHGVEDDHFGGVIKSPLDLVMGTLLFFEVQLPDYTSDPSGFYETTDNIIRLLERQGLTFYEPIEVAGYPAYHQFPAFSRNWISTNYLTRRYDFIRYIFSMVNKEDSGHLTVDILTYVRNNIPHALASDARELIMILVKYLLPMSDNLTFDRDNDENAELTAERLNYFLHAFLYARNIDVDPEGTWTLRWENNYDPDVLQGQLQSLFNALLQSPEYQLM